MMMLLFLFVDKEEDAVVLPTDSDDGTRYGSESQVSPRFGSKQWRSLAK